MKSVFIILIIFSLFISGCELVEERGSQFSYPSEDGPLSMQLDIGKHGGSRGVYLLTSVCENAFYGTCNNPSGEDIAEVHCSASANLGCAGLCYVDIDSQACGLYDIGLGNCYCLNDGVCDDDYGEPITSPDCQECTNGEIEVCNLPQVPGTCGECNAGLKTCANNQWSECEQVTDPIAEVCDNNNLDEDCDCNPDATDADCVYSHLECQNDQCIEINGQGSDQCSVDGDCVVSASCGNGILEAGEQCDIDLSSWDPAYARPYLPIYGHYTNYDLGNCNVCDMGDHPSFSPETCVCAGSYPGDGIIDYEFNLVGSIVSYEACEIDIYPEINCNSLNEGDCNLNSIQCSWRNAFSIPGVGFCPPECISNVGCYMGIGHNCAGYSCPLQEIAYEIEYGSLDNFIWNDIQSPNEESWAAGCGIVG